MKKKNKKRLLYSTLICLSVFLFSSCRKLTLVQINTTSNCECTFNDKSIESNILKKTNFHFWIKKINKELYQLAFGSKEEITGYFKIQGSRIEYIEKKIKNTPQILIDFDSDIGTIWKIQGLGLIGDYNFKLKDIIGRKYVISLKNNIPISSHGDYNFTEMVIEKGKDISFSSLKFYAPNTGRETFCLLSTKRD